MELETLLPQSKMDFLLKHLSNVVHDLNWEKLNGLGDFIEIGVYHGGTLLEIAKRLPPSTSIVGYDTFEGLPLPSTEDFDCVNPHQRGDFADTSIEALEEKLPGNVILIEGLYPDSALEALVEFAHLDVDFFESTFKALEQLDKDMVIGGVVVVDDYKWHRTPGVEKAVNDFLITRSNFEIIDTADHQIALRKLRAR